jgi:hypothetical protein
MVREALVIAASCLSACESAGRPPPAEPPSGAPTGTSSKPADEPSIASGTSPSGSAEPDSSASPADSPSPAGAPTLEGTLLGKPFHAVAACVIGAPKKGFVVIEIYDAKDFDVKASCSVLPPVPGARKIGLLLPWKAGETVDVSTLKSGRSPEGYVAEVLAT